MQISRLSDVARWVRPDSRSANDEVETIIEVREVRAPASERAAVGGDSFDEFYDAHVARAYGLAIRLLGGDGPMAEDIVVKTFVVVWQSQTDGRDGGSGDCGSMLLRQVRKCCLDTMRGRRDTAGMVEADCLSSRSDTHLTRDGANLTPKIVRDELGALSNEQCASIERAFCHGQTATQIAEDLGIPKSTVHQAMRSGLRALGARLLSPPTATLWPASSPDRKPTAG